jgi:3-hydroxybutyryl-CoA dehydrogenase
MVADKRMSEVDRQAVLHRIHGTTRYSELPQAEIVIEAAGDSYEQKSKVLKQVDRSIEQNAIIASSSSSISINRLASLMSRPDRFIGMHFLNLPLRSALVEIGRGALTSDSTHAAISALVEQLGKSSITIRNSPGSLVNRLLLPMINEAFFILDEGDVSATDIDAAMTIGCNHPIGPLALADMIGLDVVLATTQMIYGELAESKYLPCPLLKEMVDAGHLGRKSGRGVYDYSRQPG